MSQTTNTRRTASALGAASLLALLLAAPAAARPDPGTGGSDPVVVAHEPSAAQLEFHRQESLGRSGSPAAVPPGPAASTGATGTNGAADYLQLGAGMVAGIALAGAGAAVISRRSHRAAPAA